ncbi:MAG: NADP-dependent oxidoreductase [Alphaproteobacteria bacterium HGW-Alphaproteobacteria-2]|nr:MAG: NADP-dependent oxidoreductase [Alphaproteobacteria bacterium HGW-Alphaproteobacteria-2]
MLAIRYADHGGPEVLQPTHLPVMPPGPNDVLVALKAAGVSPLDCKLRAGLLAEHFTPELPKTPGRDGVGVVLATGAHVLGFTPGDRVGVMAPAAAAAGTYAGAILCSEGQLVALPDGVGAVEATTLINAGLSAWIAARTAGMRPGQRVLVHAGAGAVGSVLVQLAKHLGARVTATCRAANRDYVRGLGAERAIAYDAEDFTDLPPQDVVFDLVGGSVHERSYQVLAPGGHLVWLTAAPIIDRSAQFGVRVSRAPISDDPDAVAEVMRLVSLGRIRPQVAGRLPLAQAAEAHRCLEAGEVTRGRLVLDIEGALDVPGGSLHSPLGWARNSSMT